MHFPVECVVVVMGLCVQSFCFEIAFFLCLFQNKSKSVMRCSRKVGGRMRYILFYYLTECSSEI